MDHRYTGSPILVWSFILSRCSTFPDREYNHPPESLDAKRTNRPSVPASAVLSPGRRQWIGWSFLWLVMLWCARDFIGDATTHLFDARTSMGPIDDKTSEVRLAQSEPLDLTILGVLTMGSVGVDPAAMTLNPIGPLLVRIFTDIFGTFLGFNLLTGLLWVSGGWATRLLLRALDPEMPDAFAWLMGAVLVCNPWIQGLIRDNSTDYALFPLLILLLYGLVLLDRESPEDRAWIIPGCLLALSLSNFYYLLCALLCCGIWGFRWWRERERLTSDKKHAIRVRGAFGLGLAAYPCIGQLRILGLVDAENRANLSVRRITIEQDTNLLGELGFVGPWGVLGSPLVLCLVFVLVGLGRHSIRSLGLLLGAGILGILIPLLDILLSHDGVGPLSSLPGFWRARRIDVLGILPVIAFTLGAGLTWAAGIRNGRHSIAVLSLVALFFLSETSRVQLVDRLGRGMPIDAPTAVVNWISTANGPVWLVDHSEHAQALALHLEEWSGRPLEPIPEHTSPDHVLDRNECAYLLAWPRVDEGSSPTNREPVLSEEGWLGWASARCGDTLQQERNEP